MIFELRTYDLRPGKAPVYLDLFRTFGVSRVTRHLPMLGYWQVETGRLNRIEHLWAYESLDERDACRAGLAGDEVWTGEFVPRAFADVVSQENRFLRLDASSAAFDRAIAGRKTQHPDQSAEEPMFAPTLHALSFGRTVPDNGGRLAAFTVLSGIEPGARVTLAAGEMPDLCTAEVGLWGHELLRPLSLSPLQ